MANKPLLLTREDVQEIAAAARDKAFRYHPRREIEGYGTFPLLDPWHDGVVAAMHEFVLEFDRRVTQNAGPHVHDWRVDPWGSPTYPAGTRLCRGCPATLPPEASVHDR